MMTPTEQPYRTVQAHSLVELEDKVNKLLTLGYYLNGPLVTIVYPHTGNVMYVREMLLVNIPFAEVRYRVDEN